MNSDVFSPVLSIFNCHIPSLSWQLHLSYNYIIQIILGIWLKFDWITSVVFQAPIATVSIGNGYDCIGK